MHDFVVVGAGTAGLSFARALSERSERALVLDKSRGVGGRVATRRVGEQPVDHGVSFLHGARPDFLAALDEVEGTLLPNWPSRVEGGGRPCQPQAFRPGHRRLAFAEGLSAFPKSLARGIDVTRGARVLSLAPCGGGIEARLEEGDPVPARNLALTLPLEQTRALLAPLASEIFELRPVVRLLEMLATEPCLALLAGYDLDSPEPEWDLFYPSEKSRLMLVAHDSAKRRDKRHLVLVFQCTSQFSRSFLEEDAAVWTPLVLEEGARRLGDWVAGPVWREPHRWRYSRVSSANTLAQPLWITLPQGGRIGIGGEVFSPGGGVEAAFVSGRRLADLATEGAP